MKNDEQVGGLKGLSQESLPEAALFDKLRACPESLEGAGSRKDFTPPFCDVIASPSRRQ